MSQKLQELEQQIAALQSGAPGSEQQGQQQGQQQEGQDSEFGDFKMLSDEEFDKLVQDDPVEAIKYQNKLMRYRDRQREQTVTQAQRQVQQQREQAVIDEAAQAMSEAAPGIFDENSSIKEELSRFAYENGFQSEYLGYLTDPRTRVIPPDQSDPIVLGKGAAEVVGMINNAHQRVSKADPDSVRDQVKNEVEQELREKITQELTEKFKEGSAGRSPGLGDAPSGGQDVPVDTKKTYTEDEWMQLSPEARSRLLGSPDA